MEPDGNVEPERRVESGAVAIPEFRALMEQLTGACEELGIDFFVIGALARDLHLEHVHGITARRRTQDVDVAVALESWHAYEELRDLLTGRLGFQETDQKQRLKSLEGTLLDLVPFGGLEANNHTIRWPPDEAVAMSTLGLPEARQMSVTFVLDGDLSFSVASLPGLGLLKLIGWDEQPYERAHDAQDLALIMQSYYDVREEAVYEEHLDLLGDEKFDRDVASARIFGREVAPFLQRSEALQEKVLDVLRRETSGPMESSLAEAMESPYLVSHERRFRFLEALLLGIQERLP